MENKQINIPKRKKSKISIGLSVKEKNKMNFNDYDWHDAIIKSIQINREQPGIVDIISFEIIWNDDTIGQIIFEDVYRAKMDLGFGVVAEDSISEAFIAKETDSDLLQFWSKWKGLIKKDLFCFVIKTSSTGSEIKIIAKSFKIVDVTELKKKQ